MNRGLLVVKKVLMFFLCFFITAKAVIFFFNLNEKIVYLSYNNKYLLSQVVKKDPKDLASVSPKAKKMQKIQTQYLKAIDKLFTCNNIPYFVEGGTLIGAARQGGFIPWDDDVDYAIIGEENCKKAGELISKYGITRSRYNQTDMACAFYVKPELKEKLIKEHKVIKYTGRFRKIPVLKYLSSWHINRIKAKYTTNEKTSVIAFEHYLDGRPSGLYSKYLYDGVIEPLKKMKFEDIKINTPMNHDKFLLELYGDWEGYSSDFGKMFHNTGHHVKNTSYFKYTHEELDEFMKKAVEITNNIEKDCN